MFWVFYSDGTNMVYRTSNDGLNWISPETVRSARYGNYFSIWFDGTYLHYAYTSSIANTSLYYRRGTPNSDGSITWSAVEQTAVAGAPDIRYSYPFVSVDSDGHAWIGYRYTDLTNLESPYVTRSQFTNGTWGVTPGGFPYSLNSMPGVTFISIIPLTANNMLAVYVYDSNKKVMARLWNSTAWGSEVSTSSRITPLLYFSAVAEGNDVHLVFKNSYNNIIYSKYDYATNSFISEKSLLTEIPHSAPVLSMDEDNNLYVFWGGYPIPHTIYYMIYTAENDTWGPAVKWKSEEYLYPDSLTCFYKQYSGYTGLAYTTKHYPGPHEVKFNYIAPPPPPGVTPEPSEPGAPGAPEPTPEPEVESNTLTSSGSRHTTPKQGSVGTSQSFKNTRIRRHTTWVPVIITRA